MPYFWLRQLAYIPKWPRLRLEAKILASALQALNTGLDLDLLASFLSYYYYCTYCVISFKSGAIQNRLT